MEWIRNYKRPIATISVLLVLIISITFGIATYIQRQSETQITLYTLPLDSTISINNSRSSKSPYLKSGTYQVKIEREGFKTSTTKITVDHDNSDATNNYVISLTPNSDIGSTWMNTHSNEINEFESKAGEAQDQIGEKQRQKYPIVNILPINSPLYTIGYKADPADSSGMAIIVTVKAPEQYRQAAITYLRSQGITISNYKFLFYDQENPFK
ncbi:MAG: PEGA domain-containing protein [Candidatus Saccharimonas sp.]